jgi:hypothetical protein
MGHAEAILSAKKADEDRGIIASLPCLGKSDRKAWRLKVAAEAPAGATKSALYLLNAQIVAPHLTWDQALVLNVSSFHGRGFFEQDITLGSGYARLAAAEAVPGLLIEISFIATFTQRFFGK